ncbi:RAMP superfamily CRISPR-associated protein [Marinimicrobium sp. ARAG 43.8]|uniref:RAMP superfamily CRISPR-associated protein n=1 Tax=Marinimicrobium sp. ARAG 43.8 TaxID=3418719 RepID=UPI003CE7AEA0
MNTVTRENASMKQLSYTVRFLTPAFLGNAEQNGQWRTPPFKALLRQWWRVAYAAEKQFKVDITAMRREEGLLFGHAWLEDDKDKQGQKVAARKSAIRLRLNALEQQTAWTTGSQQGIAPLSDGLSTSYAWFGLIQRGNGLPNRTGIKSEVVAEAVRQLVLAFPDELQPRMEETIALIHAFGLLGSRSRGGWGALNVEGAKALQTNDMQRYARDIDACLQDDWAMSLASDKKGLCVWESKNTFDSWDKAMTFIAGERKAVRTALKNGKDLRPALGFASPGRMPSPLRWKAIASQPGKLTVRVFALPHCIPDEGGKRLSLQDLQSAWRTVSSTLDNSSLQRLN